MDPNSTPWSYAYNRIVPAASTTSGSSEDFQHPHLAQITAANLAASFNAAASGGSFVPPSPIASYNPTVFQQIYHHAAAASVQPKPAHFASTAVNTPHRQLQFPTTLDKQLTSFQNQAAAAAVSSAAAAVVANNVASNYYGENSSSSGASPSPTTVSLTSTSLSWNAPSMISNTFLAMQQQQAQQQQQTQQLNLISEKVQIKQENLQPKAQVKVYNDFIYLTHLQQQQPQQQIDQEIQSDSIIHQQEAEETYYTIDGQKYKVMRKEVNQQQPQLQQTQPLHIEQQIASPASYPIYVSPALSSAGGSPAPTASQVTNLHASDTITPQVIVYKTATATSSASPNKRNALSIASAGSPATSASEVNHNNNSTTAVAYSSVIQSTLQQQNHLQQNHCWTKLEDTTDGSVNEDVKNVLQLHVKQEQRNVGYVGDIGEDVGENLIFNLPPGLEIKQTFYHQSVDTELQHTQQQHLQQNQQQLLQQNNTFNNLQQQNDKSRRPHMVANMLMSPTGNSQQSQLRLQQSVNPVSTQSSSPATTASLSSQIQIVPKEEVSKQTTKPAKTPRKRQPKKSLVASEFNVVRNPQELVQHQHQQSQLQQAQQQNAYYDFNSKWNSSVKVENISSVSPVATITIPSYPHHHQQQQHVHTQHQQQQSQLPQPAHMQSSQAQSHLTNLSTYYSAFPQPIASQYNACMQQQQVYNVNQPQQQSQHQQQQLTQQIQQQQKDEEAVANEDASNKVIVPNIEEELDFLADPTTPKQGFATSTINGRSTNSASNNTNFGIRNPYTSLHISTDTTSNIGVILNNSSIAGSVTHNAYVIPPDRKPIGVGTSIGEKKTQFMDSYLKFLQGERDDDPPPVVKTGRKLSYQRSPNKRNKKDLANDEVNTSSQTSTVQTTQNSVTAGGMTIGDDGHQIKILSQTQILPKKRPHAQIAAAAAAAEVEVISNSSSAASVTQQPAEQTQQQQQQNHNSSSFRPYPQQQLIHQYAQQQQNCTQIEGGSQDPLTLPPRRELCLRKAKQSSMHAMLNSDVGDSQLAEPDEFVDSDTDPVWTPHEDDGDGCKSFKRKIARRTKSAPRKNSYSYQQPQAEHNQQQHPDLLQLENQHSVQMQQLDEYNTNQDLSSSTNFINPAGVTSTLIADNFKVLVL